MKNTLIAAAKWLFLALITVPVTIYLMLCLINISDQEKSPLVLGYEARLSVNESVPSASNGFLLALGLNAERGRDQLSVGIERLEKIQNRKSFDDSFQADTGEELPVLKKELSALARGCPSPENSIFVCLNTSTPHYEQAANILEKWQWYLERYLHVLNAKEWNEPVIYNLSNMPRYGNLGLREGQKLLFLRSYMLLHQGSAFKSSGLISQDYQSWLRQLSANKVLLSMVISLEGVNENLKWGKSLQEVLPNGFQLPAAWGIKFKESDVEKVLRRTFLYEWEFGRTTLSDLMTDSKYPKSYLARALNTTLAPLYQPLQTSNILAQLYESNVNDALTEKPNNSVTIESFCAREFSIFDYVAFSYNPTGKLLACAGVPKITEYKDKILALESTRQETLKRINTEENNG